jgi:hypothetical protein
MSKICFAFPFCWIWPGNDGRTSRPTKCREVEPHRSECDGITWVKFLDSRYLSSDVVASGSYVPGVQHSGGYMLSEALEVRQAIGTCKCGMRRLGDKFGVISFGFLEILLILCFERINGSV